MKEEILIILIATLVSLGVGIVLGNASVYLFNRIPPLWLCDYDEKPNEDLISNNKQRIKSMPFKAIFSGGFTLIIMQLCLNNWMLVIPATLATFILLQIAISDIKYMIIPDQFLLLLAITGIGFIPFYIHLEAKITVQPLGALLGFVIMFLLEFLVKLIYKKEALGFGDVKLCAVIGFLTGPIGIVTIITVGFFFGAIVSIWRLARKKIKITDECPVGQYFCGATVLYFLIVMSLSNDIPNFYLLF